MKINPLALKKSREYLGLTLEEAAKILGYKKLDIWEKQLSFFGNEVEITYKELAKIAEEYCCDTGDFLLKEFNRKDFISDFRIRENQLEELKIANNYNLKREVLTAGNYIANFEAFNDTTPLFFHNPKELLKKVSDVIDYQNQNKTNQKFGVLLKTLENFFPNLLIFQTKSNNQLDESINGICLTASECRHKAIIINHQQAQHSKVFTLLHELYHLAVGGKDTFFLSQEKNNIEKQCNDFASEVLLPKEIFQQYCQNITNWSEAEIKEASKNFNISKIHFATRLIKAEKISQECYNQLKKEYKKEWRIFKEIKERRPESNEPQKKNTHTADKPKYPYPLRNRMGRNYIRTIYDAYAYDEITLSKALYFLRIKMHDFDSLIKIV